MKKSLIALAVLATAGTAFAQSVSLSGYVDYGYFSVKDGAGVTTKGTGSDSSEIYINVSEDLGGGLKIAADMALEGMARGYPTAPLDQKITLSGGFGSVYMGSIEIGSGIRGLAQAGAPVNNMEGEILPVALDSDIIKYTSPAMSGFKLSASHVETGTGLGSTTGLNDGQTTILTAGVDYAAGPLSAKFDYSSYDANAKDDRFRVAASYDLGMAKVGAGFESTDYVDGGKDKSTMVGVSAPLGAVTVGAVWVKNDNTKAVGATGDRTGYSLGAKYSLSKRTAINASFTSWENAVGDATKSEKVKLNLSHSF